jgi:beta-glucosidase
MWFSLDMIVPQTFSQLTIDPTSSTNDFMRAYQVFVSNDAVTWGAPVASGVASAGALTIMFPTQTARFVGIVQTGTGSYWWSIGEINVYGPGATPSVLLSPTGWTATASATGGSDSPGKAIDGSLSTRWSSGTPQTNGQWFQLDMLQQRSVNKVTMNSDGSSSDYARGYQIFISNSTSSWGNAVASGTGTAALVTATFPAATGRYLKIVQTGSASNWWSIAELQVFGVGDFAPVASVLARTGWSATASSSRLLK